MPKGKERSEQGMSYLVELVVKFTIYWRSNLKIFNFCHFSQKYMTQPLIKNAKFGQKINFP